MELARHVSGHGLKYHRVALPSKRVLFSYLPRYLLPQVVSDSDHLHSKMSGIGEER